MGVENFPMRELFLEFRTVSHIRDIELFVFRLQQSELLEYRTADES